jgi:hypothetical protein
MKLRTRALAMALTAVFICGSGFAQAATLQCAPYQVMSGGPYPGSGSNPGYTADAAGIVTGVGANDVDSLIKSGCDIVGIGANTLIGRLLNVNMNLAGSGAAAQDQQIPLFLPSSQYVRYTKISVKNCSESMTTAAGGVYTASAQGGTAVVASTQAYSALTGSTLALDLTIATTPGKTEFGGAAAPAALYVNLSTEQGTAGTCDFFVYGDVGQ